MNTAPVVKAVINPLLVVTKTVAAPTLWAWMKLLIRSAAAAD